MTEKIRVGIAGYGNLGKGTELALAKNKDMELVAIFTRRPPDTVTLLTPGVPVYNASEAKQFTDKIDVMILCGGSATDLPEMGPCYALSFNTVDSFDTHAKVPEYFSAVDKAAKSSGHTSIISVGWDPGLFSINRAYGDAILPDGTSYTFWGRGVSQGHSDAVRRIEGVLDARQYTIPVETALAAVRDGKNPVLTTRQKHTRECFVVAEEGADLERIEREIKTMPHYFDEYDTTVHFISAEDMRQNHSGLPHAGSVFRSGSTGNGNAHVIEYSLKLDSNPEFTASVLVCYARAAVRMNRAGQCGAKTVLDVAPALLSAKSGEQLRAELL
jgi:diaminopimelate dehydrogenase